MMPNITSRLSQRRSLAFSFRKLYFSLQPSHSTYLYKRTNTAFSLSAVPRRLHCRSMPRACLVHLTAVHRRTVPPDRLLGPTASILSRNTHRGSYSSKTIDARDMCKRSVFRIAKAKERHARLRPKTECHRQDRQPCPK